MSKATKRELITASRSILDRYDTRITIRQLYYQLVVAKVIENKQIEYARLVQAIITARMNGDIDWLAIEDNGRMFEGEDLRTYLNGKDYFEKQYQRFIDMSSRYNYHRWMNQPKYVEVWCEKAALSNIIAPACSELQVLYGASRGQASLSWLYDASQRLVEHLDEDIFILIYSDFDPSGETIYNSIKKHLRETFHLPEVNVCHKALNEAQIKQFSLVPSPAKPKSPTYKKWIARYGDNSCVELDALEPSILRNMIRQDVNEHFDFGIHKQVLEHREQEVSLIMNLIELHNQMEIMK